MPNELHQQWLLSLILKRGRLFDLHAYKFMCEQLRHLCEKQSQGMQMFKPTLADVEAFWRDLNRQVLSEYKSTHPVTTTTSATSALASGSK